MERSLSVLMPVHNVQFVLAGAVQELLEVLPELTSRFELVIIDDGSTDATIEVADDLAARYPQITVVYHAVPMGLAHSIESGLARAVGEVIFLRDDDGCLAIDELQKLWREIDAHPLVLGRAEGSRWPNRWVGWKRHAPEGEFRMVDRKVLRDLQTSLEDQMRLVTGITRRTCSWHEVEVSVRPLRGPARRPSAPSRRKSPQTSRGSSPNPPASKPEKPRRPNYLHSLKDFALGE
ncbi:MAG: glycosyltransferase [Pirellulales bacterium]|nr:glycosyltransferase [Pirellulales bacterium]